MASTVKARPGSNTGPVLSAAIIGVGKTIAIYVVDADLNYWTNVRESTSDGNQYVEMCPSGYLYGRHTLTGIAPASVVMNVAYMEGATNVAGTFTLVYASGVSHSHSVIIRSMRVAYRRNAEYVGMTVVIEKTDTAITEVQPS